MEPLFYFVAALAVEARGGMPYQAEQVAATLASYISPPTSALDASMRLDSALTSAGLPRPQVF